MQVYRFHHPDGVKAGCCNYRTTETFWMAESREDADQEIAANTERDREDHGNCGTCLASLLADSDHEIHRAEAEQ